ncbi:MAG: DUF45 domain-containing protein [Alphaproteobacteria bacterium]|nr:DUF45 domain-containing protein [Alphaproteobacteria bacterium]MBQ8729563.1 DUF45 domain-containing protein [Alphaproteobacteria bacterium]
MAEFEFVLSNGEKIPVFIQTRRGARNITLRPKTQPAREIHMSRPWMASNSAALKFLESKRKWVENIYAKCPQKCSLGPGDEIVIFDLRVGLVHDVAQRGNSFIQNDNGTYTLVVGGGADMFERRVRDFIKSEFLKRVKVIIRTVPREFWPARIALRDTTTRWGSCSTTGTMSFSWRLAFAPMDVMRYVVMHELAHVRHMDHSPEFWATVRELYGFGVERAKRWLTKNGVELHRYF